MVSIRIISIALLLATGVSAVVGGGAMLIDPSGSNLGLSIELLKTTPFGDFFISGLLLFGVIGVLGIVTALLTILKNGYASRLTVLYGTILAGWVSVQAFLLERLDPIQIIFCGIGFTLFCLGLFEAEDDVVHQNHFIE
jgi:hypothetical protein